MEWATLRNALILVAVGLAVLYFYEAHPSVITVQLASAIGASAFGVAAIILLYLWAPRKGTAGGSLR